MKNIFSFLTKRYFQTSVVFRYILYIVILICCISGAIYSNQNSSQNINQKSNQQNSHKTAAENKQESIERWAEIFQPSVMSKNARIEELKWFRSAASDLQGITVKSAAETLRVHYWESRVLARAFEEITGIHVEHEIIGEPNVVNQIMDQIENNKQLWDIYVNDSDMIGTHIRTDGVVNLSDYMISEGRSYTNPYLDIDDFLNIDFCKDFDGNILQLPDQQFANLYWFRYDWFIRKDIKDQFKERYGYDLGVPVNWAAYEDIAEFFTNTPIDGRKVFGHLDYGKIDPSLGWRFTDAWLSMAGVGDRGLPNGSPVDEWGIRVENRIPVGSSVSRGGDLNGPAGIYALTKYLEWMNNYAPPEAKSWDFVLSGTVSSRGDIAQQIFMYITWLSDPAYHTPGSPVVDKDGKPLWRVAPSPHGKYWESGMKVGYQDVGSWTIPKNVTGKQRAAAWLWAQFCVSKTVDLKKFLVGGTPIRKSTIFSDYISERTVDYGGLIEFYRSPEEKNWSPTGLNVPYYAEMSKLWWKNIGKAIEGDFTPKQAMDNLAYEQDALMASLRLKKYSPVLSTEKNPEYWYAEPGAPKAEITPREKPVTVPYDDLIKNWTR